METFDFIEGRVPLLVSMPHPGTYVPPEIARRLTPEALTLPDTDWHLPRLYDFAGELGASLLIATHSRYVIDLNRAPDGMPLYRGASNTELCPTTLFSDRPIYLTGEEPDEAEIETRREELWSPYHRQLSAALDRMRELHGVALLFDAHSIRSEVPRFFQGRLPDLNLGSGGGTSASSELAQRLLAICAAQSGYTAVLNGRFTGGYITRHYGQPQKGIHAIQLELSQRTYMHEDARYAFDETGATFVRPFLRKLLEAMLEYLGYPAGPAIV